MSEIKDGSVHLVVTSPPYPMIEKWDTMFENLCFRTQHNSLTLTWVECARVLCNGGIMCINIGDATRTIKGKGFACYPNFAAITMKMYNLGFTPLIPIFWKKISNRPNAFLGSGMLPPNGYVSQDHEYIAIFRKGPLRKFKPKDKTRYDSQFSKSERDIWFNQTWTVGGAKNAKETSEFPLQIPNRLIQMFSIKGDTVLDPFCGTGRCMKTADFLHRKGIGYDIVDQPDLRKET